MARTLPEFQQNLSPTAATLEQLGKLVRNRRAQSRMRIDDAASLSGVSSDLLSRLENGKPVTADKLMLVLESLGLRILIVPKTDIAAIEGSDGPAGRNRPAIVERDRFHRNFIECDVFDELGIDPNMEGIKMI